MARLFDIEFELNSIELSTKTGESDPYAGTNTSFKRKNKIKIIIIKTLLETYFFDTDSYSLLQQQKTV